MTMAVGQVHIAFAVITVFIATFTLLFIFDALNKVAEQCQTQKTNACAILGGPAFPFIVLLIIIGGLIFVISTVAYILISA